MGKTQLIQLSAIVGMGMVLSGCMGNGIKLSEYKSVALQQGKFSSNGKENQSRQAKVIIMDIDNNGIETAKKINLGKSMASNINKELSENKNVQILKRVSSANYDQILSKEIEAAEIGKETGEDVGQADYLVSGQLSNVTFSNDFEEGYYSEDKKGKRTYHPPQIKYKACVQGSIKVFGLPDLNEQESKSFDECSSQSEEARSPSDAKPSNGSLEREAGTEAMNSVAYALKSFFTPKAYINAMKKNGDDIIIRVSVGKNQGAKEGDVVHIFTMTDDGAIKVGEGEITNKITNNNSWVTVEELEDDHHIQKGDYVKIHYKEGLWSKFKKGTDLSKYIGI